jgi:hypothetical protein
MLAPAESILHMRWEPWEAVGVGWVRLGCRTRPSARGAPAPPGCGPPAAAAGLPPAPSAPFARK